MSNMLAQGSGITCMSFPYPALRQLSNYCPYRSCCSAGSTESGPPYQPGWLTKASPDYLLRALKKRFKRPPIVVGASGAVSIERTC